MLRRRRQRVVTGLATPLVAATHWSPSTRPHGGSDRAVGDFSLGAPVDCADHAAPTAAALYFFEPDTLGLELCVSVEAPTWVDPMLDELAASLVVSRLAGAKATGCPSASTTVAQEYTSRVDTCSPVKELATLLVVSPLA